jgi:antirestriction protein ArdC
MKTDRVDIHQHITDKIVSAIERGAGDFHLPWHRCKTQTGIGIEISL